MTDVRSGYNEGGSQEFPVNVSGAWLLWSRKSLVLIVGLAVMAAGAWWLGSAVQQARTAARRSNDL
jgi:hypothetical protein